MEPRRDVFQAIADPTRREIIGLLAGRSQNLNSLAANFDMTRQAISLHVKILTECGLVTIRPQGRERICEAHMERLCEVHDWTAQYRVFWTAKLLALKDYVEKETATPKKKSTKKKK